MKIKRYSELEPISKHTFQKHIRKSFLFQIFNIMSIYLGLRYSEFRMPEIHTIPFLMIIIVGSFMWLAMAFDVDMYRQRFKAIYPESELSYWQMILIFFFPLVFFGVTFFLYFKEPVNYIKRALPYRYIFLVIVPIFVLEIINTRMAYNIGSPPIYYVSDITSDAIKLLKIAKAQSPDKSVVATYISQNETLSASEVVLLMAVSLIHLKKELKTKKISKEMEPFLYGTRVLDDSYRLLVQSEKRTFNFMNYGLIHWLYPAGPMQIVMFEAVDKSIYLKLNTAIYEKNSTILSTLKKRVTRLPASDQNIFREKLNAIESKYESSRTFKILIQERIDNSFPVK